MDREKLQQVVAAIPVGRWMSYADVCVAAGGFADEARSVNRRLVQLEVKGAHRVLRADGSIAPTALDDPDALMPPSSVAESYWMLYQQPKGAWTFELEIRPFGEKW